MALPASLTTAIQNYNAAMEGVRSAFPSNWGMGSKGSNRDLMTLNPSFTPKEGDFAGRTGMFQGPGTYEDYAFASYAQPAIDAYNAANQAYLDYSRQIESSNPWITDGSQLWKMPEVQEAFGAVNSIYQDLSNFQGSKTPYVSRTKTQQPGYSSPWSNSGNGKGPLGQILAAGIPLALNYFMPGIGGSLGTALGIGQAAGSALLGAGLGAATAKATGGKALTGALTGGIGGYLGGGGFSDITKGLGLDGLLSGTSLGGGGFGGLGGMLGDFGTQITGFFDDPVGGITSLLEDQLNTKNLLKSGIKLGLGSLLQDDNEGGYNAVQNAANTAAGYYQPFLQSGTAANKSIADLYGLNGPDAQKAAFAGFQTSPGFQFAKEQGIKGLDASAAKRGMLLSGNQLQAVQDFGSGLASREFNRYIDDLMRTSAAGQAAAQGVGQNQVDAATAYAALKANKANNRNSLYASLLDFL